MAIPKDFTELLKETINSSNSSEDLGNNIPSPAVKQCSPSIRWCWTYNNYKKEEISSINHILCDLSKVFIFSEEVGASGTPHLQGYTEFNKKVRPFRLLKEIGTIHWIKCKGDRQSNIDYCSKTTSKVWSKGLPKPLVLIEPDLDWQIEILEMIHKEPDNRTINWYWGEGGIGKTQFCKYLCKTEDFICLSGKGNDCRNGIVEYELKHHKTPHGVIINVPREFGGEYVSYEALENIKDMFFYSGKYKGGMINGNSPWLLVFANVPPECSSGFMKRIVVKELHATSLLKGASPFN